MRMSNRRWAILALIVLFPVVAAIVSRPMISRFRDPPMSLRVDLSERVLEVLEDGDVVQSYGVAIGLPSHPTPTGTFWTGRIDWNPAWTPPNSEWARDEVPREPGDPANPMQGVKIYFKYPTYFIHGTNAPSSIGSAASHGCLRMETSEAKALARRIQKHGSVKLVIQR